MRSGLGATIPRMIGVQQYASAERFIVCKEAGNSTIELSNVNMNPELELKHLHKISDRADTEAQALAAIPSHPARPGKKLCGAILSFLAAIHELSKARREVDVHGLLAQQCVDRSVINPSELLQLVHPHASLSLFDGDKSRVCYFY